ncbi:MAG: hypothetical protein QNI85_15865 [Desulfobacterales bacterium]|nr:hypothetical protein [Desulfobacterales bacterium]
MLTCPHNNLLLLAAPAPKLRCRHCHLTIAADELDGGPCPECYEASGRRRYDFETLVEAPGSGQYRCEDCGILIPGS